MKNTRKVICATSYRFDLEMIEYIYNLHIVILQDEQEHKCMHIGVNRTADLVFQCCVCLVLWWQD